MAVKEEQNQGKEKEIVVKRDKHGRLLPGSNLNPAGRTKGVSVYKAQARELQELGKETIEMKLRGRKVKDTRLNIFLRELWRDAILGDMTARKLVCAYQFGMPRQSIKFDTPQNVTLLLEAASDNGNGNGTGRE